MKQQFFYPEEEKKDNNVIFHMDSIEATLKNKPYIVSANKSVKYSKLDKAKKKEDKKLKKELDSYRKYDI